MPISGSPSANFRSGSIKKPLNDLSSLFSNIPKQINLNPFIINSSLDNLLINTTRQFPFRWIMGSEPKDIAKNILLFNLNRYVLDRNMVMKDWGYYYQNARVLLLKKDFNGVVKLYKEAYFLKYYIDTPNIAEMFTPFIQAAYLTGDYSLGRKLLLDFVLYENGNLNLALKMEKDMSMLGEYTESVKMLDQDIKRILRN
ncbi:MAG: hypothetical protein HQK93_02365 [Nitrospirae bacterium]|nr:hypothetical protein [Nitrospirota bacterium]